MYCIIMTYSTSCVIWLTYGSMECNKDCDVQRATAYCRREVIFMVWTVWASLSAPLPPLWPHRLSLITYLLLPFITTSNAQIRPGYCIHNAHSIYQVSMNEWTGCGISFTNTIKVSHRRYANPHIYSRCVILYKDKAPLFIFKHQEIYEQSKRIKYSSKTQSNATI
jgi:hypothetical protein